MIHVELLSIAVLKHLSSSDDYRVKGSDQSEVTNHYTMEACLGIPCKC